MERIHWDQYFMILAKVAALRSGCNSRPTGAIIVKEKRVLCTGYNGPVSGHSHCTDNGPNFCLRRSVGAPDVDKYNICPANHAEANAIAQASKFGVSLKDAEIYQTLSPCFTCLKLLKSVGIVRIFFEHHYESKDSLRDERWFESMKDFDIEITKVEITQDTFERVVWGLQGITSKRKLEATE